MAKKKENLKNAPESEPQKKLAALREEIRVIHFKAQGSRSKNVKEAASIRKQIARVLTEINKNKKNK